MSFRAALPLISLILLLNGCQQAAWKAGANTDDLKRDETICQAQTPADTAAIKQCLRGKGWTVAEFPASSDTDASIETPEAETATSSTPRESADSLQRQSVQTWWKAGAQAADFNNDANICLRQLGEQHAPDYAKHLFTRAMVACLRSRDWIAGHDPVYTPLR